MQGDAAPAVGFSDALQRVAGAPLNKRARSLAEDIENAAPSSAEQ